MNILHLQHNYNCTFSTTTFPKTIHSTMVAPGRAGGSQGSSTGAPGIPVPMQDTRSHYDPATTGYNPATGASYSKPSAGKPREETYNQNAPSNSYDRTAGQDDRIQYAPSTVQRAEMEEAAATSKMDRASESRATRASEDLGRKVKGVGASVHGAGESIRGALNAAVDRAFGSDESAERNEEIARRGEGEIRTGEFSQGEPRIR
ncbi:uncharacterized protein N7496_011222 [Penicillium cataractarum]|uniref:Uncharacterized protein n=1 Tax=Penicillium cataractarum TaxID=2100454 RepID=A0A9W9UW51_9EURO|nr:uncharacterized protein N7496_011222 [Penicillium cataractarum]KAJ5358809.1 hypothetical protein N7496_011222 [Penicillium cataractarum]